MSLYIDDREFKSWDNERIETSFLNILTPKEIDKLKNIREQISDILDYVISDDHPEWFVNFMNYIINRFLIIAKMRNNQNQEITIAINSYINNLIYGNYDGVNRTNNNFTIPFVESYARTVSIGNAIKTINKYDRMDAIEKFNQNATSAIQNQEKKFSEIKSQIEKSLELVDKEAGKLGVKNYAEIFEQQAKSHSNFCLKDLLVGKAECWIISGIVCVVFLIVAFTKLDQLFDIKNAVSFTPEISIHVVGRIVLISIFIFLISFCFKQYRVNMHLHTLNKHRANTLKSFEYLSRAPDKLEPSSYNAILMEVAKAIYESGQTGYISNSESNGDLPSIIDMTKIFNNTRP